MRLTWRRKRCVNTVVKLDSVARRWTRSSLSTRTKNQNAIIDFDRFLAAVIETSVKSPAFK
jgi:hypothetical protein